MNNFQNNLTEGFASVELEERLEMVHLSTLSEDAAASICTDSYEIESDSSDAEASK